MIDRVLARVRVDENCCWIWQGSVTSKGYGKVTPGDGARKFLSTHRVAYEHFRGPLAEGMTIDHLCRVRACCNPWHLEQVTNRENVLRGEGVTADLARRTHCAAGHALGGANVLTRRSRPGHRECRACAVERTRRWRKDRR